MTVKCDYKLKTEQREHRLCISPVNVADNVDQPLGTLRLPPLGARVALNQSVGPVLEPECSSSGLQASEGVTATLRSSERHLWEPFAYQKSPRLFTSLYVLRCIYGAQLVNR